MDVAIRAVNWLAALVVAGDEATTRPWFDEVLASLLLHARFIRSHLEYGPARGNHYLSDVVGLLCTASVFIGSDEGCGLGQLGGRGARTRDGPRGTYRRLLS